MCWILNGRFCWISIDRLQHPLSQKYFIFLRNTGWGKKSLHILSIGEVVLAGQNIYFSIKSFILPKIRRLRSLIL